MATRRSGKAESLAYQQGDHICALYDTSDEQLEVAIAYIVDGLQRNERCLYAAGSEDALAIFRARLARGGIDVPKVERSGALMLLTKHQAYLQGGAFDCERMLHMLSQNVEQALNAGFIGLRTCGDMSWVLDEAPGSEHVVEYEALLNEFFGSVRALGMCQYDRRRLPAGP